MTSALEGGGGPQKADKRNEQDTLHPAQSCKKITILDLKDRDLYIDLDLLHDIDLLHDLDQFIDLLKLILIFDL